MIGMGQKYNDLSSQKTKKILKTIIKNDVNQSFNEKHAKILEQDLAFAGGWKRILCEDYSSVPFESKAYLLNGNDLKILEYTSDPWTDNKFQDLTLDLNSLNIESYIKFYFDYFISGSDNLKPVSYSDDIDWQDDLSPTLRQSLDKDFVLYPQIHQEKDNFTVKMPCVFRQSIMIVTFFVYSSGQIEIKDRQSLVDDLPIRNFA